jgi:hypothetical protein
MQIVQSNYLTSQHYPANEIEFRALFSKDPPRSAWNTKLEYRTDPDHPNHFWIDTMSPDLIYFEADSQRPDKGVYSFPY